MRGPRSQTASLATVWVMFAALAVPSCTCRNGVENIVPGFRVASGDTLAFGRVLENTRATKSITLAAETRVAVTVTMMINAPFSVQTTATIEGGGQLDVPVTFLARNGAQSAVLLVTAGQQQARITVTGLGVRPALCTPSAPCRSSSYVFDEDKCVEAVLADDTSCEPTSECLEQGRCRSGQCLGIARRCNDNDVCSIDACAMGFGCVHTPKPCPAPANPCHIATCDARAGCGETEAADLTPCGPLDCVSLSVCLSGRCTGMATPEGVECSPALACLGKGFCRNQKCERSDAGPWLPAWSAQIAGTPVGAKPALLANNNGVFFEACDVPVMTDAGAFFDDAGTISDSGVVMTLSCALSSYTRSGFDRFVKPFSDGARRRLVQVSNEAVVMLADAGLEWRSPSTGEVVQTLMTSIAIDSPRAVAGMRDGTVVIALPLDDGGTRIIGWSDAGVTELASPGFSVKLIALDENEGLVGFDPVTGSLMLPRDSGVVMLDRGQPSSLITANGVVFAGIKHLVRALDDGGTQVLTLEWSNDAGQPFELDSRTVLMGQGASVVFYRRCSTPMMSCLDSEKPMFVRAFDSVTGAMQYEAQVLPEGDASLEEAALIGTLRGAVAAFVHGALDAGSINAGLEVFIDKQSPVLCPLPERVVKVRGALFWAGRLFVLDDRGATGSTLQAFDLGALPLLGSGWSSADGFGATRRAGP